MTEYWISKKQYWCKYCSIFIRDDAPSRKQHETGLKHLGNRERFIRDLYRGGDKAKREKAAEAIEIKRIENAAAAAYSKDTHTAGPSRMSTSVLAQLQAAAASTSRLRDSKPKDKFADYSTAQQLGFDDEETSKSTYEIEQELKGRAAREVGAWEVVQSAPEGYYSPKPEGGVEETEKEEAENFKFQHRDKRPVRDIYEDEEWDPRTALKGLKRKMKVEGGENGEGSGSGVNGEAAGGLKREEWTGRLELVDETRNGKGKGRIKDESREGMVFVPNGGGWIKAETVDGDERTEEDGVPGDVHADIVNGEANDVKPDLPDPVLEDTKPVIEETSVASSDPTRHTSGPYLEEPAPSTGTETTAPPANGLFKKRRPPPSARKK